MTLAFAFVAALLVWDPVITDITGAPETVAAYHIYSRKAATSDPWVKIGEAPSTQLTLPTPAAKQEYSVSAVDLAGNEGDRSVAVTAKPDTPKNPRVER